MRWRRCCATQGNTGGTAPAGGKFEKEVGCMTPTRNDHSAHRRLEVSCLPSAAETPEVTLGDLSPSIFGL